MQNKTYFCWLVLTFVVSSAHSQTYPVNASNNLNLLNRNFITTENLAAMNSQMTLPTPAFSPPQTASGNATVPPTTRSAESLLEKFKPSTVPPTPSIKPNPAQTPPPASVAKPTAQPSQPMPTKTIERYIPDFTPNTSRLSFYQQKGELKNAYYSGKYSEPARTLPSAASNTQQLEILAPYIAQLRQAGLDEGKISVELNRLTPAQFAHWAKQVLN